MDRDYPVELSSTRSAGEAAPCIVIVHDPYVLSNLDPVRELIKFGAAAKKCLSSESAIAPPSPSVFLRQAFDQFFIDALLTPHLGEKLFGWLHLLGRD